MPSCSPIAGKRCLRNFRLYLVPRSDTSFTDYFQALVHFHRHWSQLSPGFGYFFGKEAASTMRTCFAPAAAIAKSKVADSIFKNYPLFVLCFGRNC